MCYILLSDRCSRPPTGRFHGRTDLKSLSILNNGIHTRPDGVMRIAIGNRFRMMLAARKVAHKIPRSA